MLYVKGNEWKGLLKECRRGWYWFALALAGCMTIAALFIFVKNKKFEVYTSVRITGGSTGGSLMATLAKNSGFGDILGMGGTEVDNELMIMQSHHVLYNAVKETGYNVDYNSRPVVKRRIYWKDSPILLTADDPNYSDTLGEYLRWKIKVSADGKKASVTCKTADHGRVCDVSDVDLPAHLVTEWGSFTLQTTEYFVPGESIKVKVGWASYTAAAQALLEDLKIGLMDKKSDIIEMSLKDAVPGRTVDLLNAIVHCYEQYSVEAKNRKAGLSSELLQMRIDTVANELASLEYDIEQYKRTHNLAYPELEAKAAVEMAGEIKSQMMELEVERNNVKMLQQYVQDPRHAFDPLPLVTTVSGKGDSEALAAYNNAIIQYQRLQSTALGDNPALVAARANIETLRQAVELTLRNMESNLTQATRQVEREGSKLDNLKSQAPMMEREYITLLRQQELKQKIYVMLLAQLEQNALTINQDTPRGQRVDEAWVNVLPSGPKPVLIVLAALIFSLFLPLAWIRILGAMKKTLTQPDEVRALKGINADIYVMDGNTEDLRQLAFALQGRTVMLSMKGEAETGDLAAALTPCLTDGTTLVVTPAFVEKADAMYELPKSDAQLLVVRRDVTLKEDMVYVETLAQKGLLKNLTVAWMQG